MTYTFNRTITLYFTNGTVVPGVVGLDTLAIQRLIWNVPRGISVHDNKTLKNYIRINNSFMVREKHGERGILIGVRYKIKLVLFFYNKLYYTNDRYM